VQADERSEKAERRFQDAVRLSGLVAPADLEWAAGLKDHGASQGRRVSLDRVLVKFKLLTREQADSIALAVRYHVWRKEDKFYAKLAIQSKLIPPEAAKAALKEQKELYRNDGRLRRLNAVMVEKKLVSAKEDRAIIEAMRKLKAVTLAPADAAPPEPEPAKPLKLGGIFESRASGSGLGSTPRVKAKADEPLDLLDEDDESVDLTKKKAAPKKDPFGDEDSAKPSIGLDEDDDSFDLAQRDRKNMKKAAKQGEEKDWRERALKRDLDDLGDALESKKPAPKRRTSDSELDELSDALDAKPLAPVKRGASDEDLDALWAEADLDDIELDSEQREVAKGATKKAPPPKKKGASFDESDADLRLDDD
jgi:hypothetical protein